MTKQELEDEREERRQERIEVLEERKRAFSGTVAFMRKCYEYGGREV